ncbi:MAG: dTMP kinase [Sulfurovum sp.]|nr:dTMP kinase [Sulfurovaceae bacterium]
MYILFEGIDTCGKSTQINLLKKQHPELLITKEPGGTEFGIKAREILLDGRLNSKRAELLLFVADRAEHYHQVIKPNSNRLILSDRGFISGISYALANGDFDIDMIFSLNMFALEDDLPDKVILFITDLETLKSRSDKKKELDGIELRGFEYLLTVQEYMKDIIIRLNIPHLFIAATDSIENTNNIISDYIKGTR